MFIFEIGLVVATLIACVAFGVYIGWRI